MAAPAAKRAKVEPLTADANAIISFRLLQPGQRSGEDRGCDFQPLMSHQLFGDEETVEGHHSPAACVYISSLTYESSVHFESAKEEHGATKVKAALEDNFEEGLKRDLSSLLECHSFARGLDKEVLGQPLHSSAASAAQVYRYQLCEVPEGVKSVHKRAQQLLTFFVDGATPLDQAEPGWDLLVAVKTVDGVRIMVGFCTVYRLYAYPSSSRLRVSQILVMPPFQKQGIGRLLIESVYKLADTEELQDIIYEDPTADVEALRDRIELCRAEVCPWLLERAAERGDASPTAAGGTGAPTSLALSADELARARRDLRIPKQQVRRVWECLLARQPPLRREPGVFGLRGLVARRLLGGFADTKSQAVGKQIFTFDELGSFCMRRVPLSEGLRGAPVALEDRQEEGQSAEEREAALEDAIERRMGVLLGTGEDGK